MQLGRALVDRIGPKGKLIRAVAGFDATFSAPKSVSILWALTGDAGVVAAHDVAVRATLDYLERHGATTRVRVHDRRWFPDANGLTMAVFQQGTSREEFHFFTRKCAVQPGSTIFARATRFHREPCRTARASPRGSSSDGG